MSERRIGVGRLLRLFDVGTVSELSDAESIDRFAVADVDREATEARVARHRPMISSVCRRFVREARGAEDAFQATSPEQAWTHGVRGRLGNLLADIARDMKQATSGRKRL